MVSWPIVSKDASRALRRAQEHRWRTLISGGAKG